ncbi:WD40/YVTN/BNR-like repeat-containing protein [Marinobacter sp. X15-166B]|uniref:WD40/YVTN/BNR-like repeat-containing protein n=1 Tax=Marinobacter sp. X15-166B TaxID=1897620 RepID=UPI00085C64EB|nr:YCF48-related protein [Marinobacter sp. X15-166B]OEY66975.1 photosystem I reaction center subunit IV [Marinobacter sp. X15-166B]
MAIQFTDTTVGALVLGLSLVVAAPAAVALTDALDRPARATDLAPSHLLTDASRAGDRIVAAGERGHIIYSDDGGADWHQGQVPVSVTLTGIDFPTADTGWAVGHSGVVLKSEDAGQTWAVQLTGVGAAELVIAAKTERAAELEREIEQAPEADREDLEWALDDLYFALENLQADLDVGPVNPLLDVWFEDDRHGFVVGAYGMILRTNDGGDSWHDWSGHIENGSGFHLNAITRIAGGALVIVGEEGQIFVSTDRGDTWSKRDSPYEGSLFGVLGTDRAEEILVFGLRGHIFQSADLGESWSAVPTDASATLNGGALLDDGRIVLVGNGGAVLTSNPERTRFTVNYRGGREGVMAVVPLSANKLLVMGESGVKPTDAHGNDL